MRFPSSRKNLNSSSAVISKRMIIVAVVFVLSLLFLTQKYFLNDHNMQHSQSNELLSNTQQGSNQNRDIKSDEEVVASENDVYLGPIKLKNSGYIGDSLDTFVNENKPTSPPTSADEVKLGSEKEVDISIEDFVLHPISSVSKLTTTFITDYTNNGRKTTLIKLIDSVSRYYVTYDRFPTTGEETSYDWIEEMVDKKEMSGVYSYILEGTSPVSNCGSVEQTGYCYDSDERDAIIYVKIEGYSNESMCGESPLFLLWSSSDNRLGQVCLEGAPTSLSGFNYIKEN